MKSKLFWLLIIAHSLFAAASRESRRVVIPFPLVIRSSLATSFSSVTPSHTLLLPGVQEGYMIKANFPHGAVHDGFNHGRFFELVLQAPVYRKSGALESMVIKIPDGSMTIRKFTIPLRVVDLSTIVCTCFKPEQLFGKQDGQETNTMLVGGTKMIYNRVKLQWLFKHIKRMLDPEITLSTTGVSLAILNDSSLTNYIRSYALRSDLYQLHKAFESRSASILQ